MERISSGSRTIETCKYVCKHQKTLTYMTNEHNIHVFFFAFILFYFWGLFLGFLSTTFFTIFEVLSFLRRSNETMLKRCIIIIGNSKLLHLQVL